MSTLPEPRAWSPLWLEHSGLPAHIAAKVRGGAGWPVFKKIVELDCAANARPDAVELSLNDLGALIGLDGPAVRRAVQSLRKLRLLACFLPDTDDEAALLKVRVPLETPVTPDQLRAAKPGLFGGGPWRFRYSAEDEGLAAAGDNPDAADAESADPVLREIVDLYFDSIGLRMNVFVLDELRLVRGRFPIDEVRRVFRRAKQNEVRSLPWVVRELARAAKAKAAADANPLAA